MQEWSASGSRGEERRGEAHVCEDLVHVAAVAHSLVALHLVEDRLALQAMRELVVANCTQSRALENECSCSANVCS